MKTEQATDVIEKHIDQLAENLDSGHGGQLTEFLSKMKLHPIALEISF